MKLSKHFGFHAQTVTSISGTLKTPIVFCGKNGLSHIGRVPFFHLYLKAYFSYQLPFVLSNMPQTALTTTTTCNFAHITANRLRHASGPVHTNLPITYVPRGLQITQVDPKDTLSTNKR